MGMLILLVPTDYSLCKNIFKKAIVPKKVIMYMPLLYISAGVCCLLFYLSQEFTAEYFYPFYYSVMFMWSRNMIQIQLQFIIKQKYNVFNRATNMLIVSSVAYFLVGKYLPVTGSQYFTVWAILQGIVFF